MKLALCPGRDRHSPSDRGPRRRPDFTATDLNEEPHLARGCCVRDQTGSAGEGGEGRIHSGEHPLASRDPHKHPTAEGCVAPVCRGRAPAAWGLVPRRSVLPTVPTSRPLGGWHQASGSWVFSAPARDLLLAMFKLLFGWSLGGQSHTGPAGLYPDSVFAEVNKQGQSQSGQRFLATSSLRGEGLPSAAGAHA